MSFGTSLSLSFNQLEGQEQRAAAHHSTEWGARVCGGVTCLFVFSRRVVSPGTYGGGHAGGKGAPVEDRGMDGPGEALAAAEAAPPVESVDVIAASWRRQLGARSVSFLVTDFTGASVVRLGTVDGIDLERSADPIAVSGTVYDGDPNPTAACGGRRGRCVDAGDRTGHRHLIPGSGQPPRPGTPPDRTPPDRPSERASRISEPDPEGAATASASLMNSQVRKVRGASRPLDPLHRGKQVERPTPVTKPQVRHRFQQAPESPHTPRARSSERCRPERTTERPSSEPLPGLIAPYAGAQSGNERHGYCPLTPPRRLLVPVPRQHPQAGLLRTTLRDRSAGALRGSGLLSHGSLEMPRSRQLPSQARAATVMALTPVSRVG